ncbi:MAG: hypothetical protein ABSF50_21735 [Burkholderiaceae bacterium]|jgi:hypothetical protein
MTEPKYVFLNRTSLSEVRPRVILIGASNTAVGFKPSQLSSLLPGQEIDNLAVGGSNITQLAQIVDLVQQVQSAETQRETTFVIGIWYGLFATDRAKWYTPERHGGDTDIDIERYRYAFYLRTAKGPELLLPPQDLSLGVRLIHPLLVLDKLSRDATRSLRYLVRGKAPERTDSQRDATVLSESDKQAALAYWDGQMQTKGPLSEEQFVVLRTLVEKILAAGSKVILVDLPIPQWHSQSSPFYASYRERLASLLASLSGRPGFTFDEMKDADSDLDFSDEVHPKPRVTKRWATSLAAELQRALHESTETPTEARTSP